MKFKVTAAQMYPSHISPILPLKQRHHEFMASINIPSPPGVSNLRTLLTNQKDEDAPRLLVLLVEALLAVYIALLLHALAVYDANLLYRLVANLPRDAKWAALFGGGLKKLVRIATSTDQNREYGCFFPPIYLQ